MREDEKICVIIPAFNVEKYIGRCIDSIVRQSYKNYRMIIVDDGSTDKTPELIDDFATHYDNIEAYHKENGGVSSARNYGIEKMSGGGTHIVCSLILMTQFTRSIFKSLSVRVENMILQYVGITKQNITILKKQLYIQ